MSPRLAFAIDLAVKAGKSTLAHFQTGIEVQLKPDETPVTVADLHAEDLVRDAIARAYPGESILGEEEGEQGDGSSRWILDPIDGTKSFISGVPLFATLIAYERAGEPVLGVCYFPALNELIYAEQGHGAYWNGRPARVSEAERIQGQLIVSGSLASLVRCGRLRGFQSLEERALAARTWGDAYGHALVATGRAVAMIDPLVARWDVSAMAVIVREAHGRFTDFSGDETLSREALSSNGRVHDELVEAFAA